MNRERLHNLIRIAVAALLAVSILALPGREASAAELSVTVKPRAEVTSDQVTLKDIAVISGPDGALKNDLAEVHLSRAPRPGQSLTIRRSYIEYRLRDSGLPLDGIEFSLPEKTEMTRAFQEIDTEWVRRVIMEYLSGSEVYQGREWELVSLTAGRSPRLPSGELTYQCMPQGTASPDKVNLTIYLSVDGKEAGRIRATGQINLLVSAVVPVRRIERGYRIQAEDLKTVQVSLARVKKGSLTDPASAVGLTTRSRLSPGQPVKASDLFRDSVIERGDMVTIVAESGPIRVSTLGQAKQDGAVGDQIAVLNMSSKKIIKAEVAGPDQVRVTF
ncbi:MAG: flagellar basal body P-ring formation chaperone FlgA [Proteobacteria bacterium]|nr:flagellar basal body P-ring formation chaperone FlgA [Pseudomonadota bacterium]